MNDAIMDSLEVLLSACLELRRECRLNAQLSYSPHVDVIEVFARPHGHDYMAEEQPDFLFWERIYISGQNAVEPLAKLHALIDRLNSYRAEAAA